MTVLQMPVDSAVSPSSGHPRLAFDRTGSGEPLVLLHGQGFSRRSWDPVVAALAEHRDVIAVDLPGGRVSASVTELPG